MTPSTQPGGKPTPPQDGIASSHQLIQIDGHNRYCDLQLERTGNVPLPHTEDPFIDDLGYGAAIHVVSTNITHRLTWRILTWIMEGLWGFLVEGERNVVRELEGALTLSSPSR